MDYEVSFYMGNLTIPGNSNCGLFDLAIKCYGSKRKKQDGF